MGAGAENPHENMGRHLCRLMINTKVSGGEKPVTAQTTLSRSLAMTRR